MGLEYFVHVTMIFDNPNNKRIKKDPLSEQKKGTRKSLETNFTLLKFTACNEFLDECFIKMMIHGYYQVSNTTM